jgi:PAS domain S-box-containing protein
MTKRTRSAAKTTKRVARKAPRAATIGSGAKRRQNQVRKERDLLRTLVDHIPDVLWVKDAESRFLIANKATLQQTGMSSLDDLLGKTDLDFFPAEDARGYRAHEKGIMESGQMHVGNEERTLVRGERRWSITTKIPVRDSKGRVVGLVGVVRDITGLKAAQTALAHERDLLHALMDNIPDLIYFKDSEHRYTRVNRAHAQALGLRDVGDAAGRTDTELNPPERAQAIHDAEASLLSAGRPIVGQIEHDARRGRWYLVTKVPLRDGTGAVNGLVGISKDITERREAEEKLGRDLSSFLAVVSDVAQGNLTLRGKEGEDTLGRIASSVNQMLVHIATLLTEARDAAFSVSTAAAQIFAATSQIARGAQYGSDQVHSASSAVDEMAASMARVSENATSSSASAGQVLQHVRRGDGLMSAFFLGMTRIDVSVMETADKMKLLEKRSREVFEIIRFIEEIASQSNLLSLNAAIEAAHAGEAGRGFGVVADEIRRLADRSTEATRAATVVVEGIVGETRAVLDAMQGSMSEVKNGRHLAEQSQESLKEISGLAQKSVELTSDISASASEQALATRTVADAMQAIVNMTLESSLGAAETTKAAKDLVALSEHLTQAIARFRIE